MQCCILGVCDSSLQQSRVVQAKNSCNDKFARQHIDGEMVLLSGGVSCSVSNQGSCHLVRCPD